MSPTETQTKESPKDILAKVNKKKKSKKWLIIIVILAVIILAVVLLPRFLTGRVQHNAQTEYIQSAVMTRTITSSLSGSGTLQPANSYTVTSLVEGEILATSFEEGDIVEQDTILYEIDSSDASNNIEKSQISLEQAQRNYEKVLDNCNIKTTISGSVYALNVELGDEVKQGQEIAVIRDSDTMVLVLPFASDDAENFYVGQAASVTLDNSFEVINGTVKKVSGSDTVGVGNVITRNVTILVQNPGGLGTTQSATATIDGVGSSGHGTFTYKSERKITASASGIVTAIIANEGERVEKDEIIVTLGGEDIEDSIRNSKDNLRNAELSMENTENQLENYNITSPISGTVVDKVYKTGDNAESGRTLCTIYDLSYLEFTISIDELDISKISVGQTVQVTAEAVEGKVYTGVVTKVSLLTNSTMGGATTYPATVRIDETHGLLPGMNVDAEIIIEQAENVITVPNAAISRGNMVMITSDSPGASAALETKAPDGYVYVAVEMGISDNDYTQIISGITEGDTVAYRQTSSASSNMAFGMAGGMAFGGGMPSGNRMPSGSGGMMGGR